MTRAEGVADLLAYCVTNRIGRPGQFAPEALVADHRRLVALTKDLRVDLTRAQALVSAAIDTVDIAIKATR